MISGKRGQMAIFVIVAIAIVVGVIVYFVVSGEIETTGYPSEFNDVFDYYQSCIESETRAALDLAGSQGGYVEASDYIPGSEYAPSSSHLNFLGFPVPYWYYVSGNGIIREQVPSLQEIESGIEDFVSEGLKQCDFESFFAQGFVIERGDADVNVEIREMKSIVKVSSDLSVKRGEDSASKNSHNVEINSKFGKFYSLAREIYDTQKEKALFEQYGTDVLRLYAPVDGVEIQCAPKVWSTQEVIGEIKKGLDENFRTIKFKGNYYDLKDEERKYFVIDKPVDESVNLVYSENWPTKIEVDGDDVDDTAMIAEAVGTQEGMGIMGFCYVPYHFVYDLYFPVMVQIYDLNEMFQFPVVAVVENNVPREAIVGESLIQDEENSNLCKFKTQEVEVALYDSNLNFVDGNVSYECFDQRCRLGGTVNGKARGMLPSCVNGYLHIRADGFADKKQLFSSNKEIIADVLMEREYELDIDMKNLDRGNAIVSFTRNDGKTSSVVLPGDGKVKLSEGQYDIKAYIYGNSTIRIPATTKSECMDAPRDGLLGFVGMTEEKCFDITIPETKIDYALIGGGAQSYYILESELMKGKITVTVDRFTAPSSLEKLAENFELAEAKGVGLNFHE
ncbi:hypothetical protein J4402_04995 [Candidatus Pacearchaeota archaeon]|nr:hypothetical protein [Candidatus Pacearchaeota archaeon]